MRSPDHRMSLGLINLSTMSAKLFFKIVTALGGSTNITMTGILQRFSEEVLDIVHDIIPLLGVGDISNKADF